MIITGPSNAIGKFTVFAERHENYTLKSAYTLEISGSSKKVFVHIYNQT